MKETLYAWKREIESKERFRRLAGKPRAKRGQEQISSDAGKGASLERKATWGEKGRSCEPSFVGERTVERLLLLERKGKMDLVAGQKDARGLQEGMQM